MLRQRPARWDSELLRGCHEALVPRSCHVAVAVRQPDEVVASPVSLEGPLVEMTVVVVSVEV